jgi:uncharacterized protein YciW
MEEASGPADVIETIIGVAPGSALARLRAERPEMMHHTQGSHDALMTPAEPGGLSPGERALIASRVAELAGHAGLAEHYRGLVNRRGAELAPSPRLALILDHVARVTTAPGSATKAHLDALRGAGLAAKDIVTLSQIIAFVSYQVRLAAGLALLAQEKSA